MIPEADFTLVSAKGNRNRNKRSSCKVLKAHSKFPEESRNIYFVYIITRQVRRQVKQ